MCEFGIDIGFTNLDRLRDHREAPAYSIAENIKLLKNTLGEIGTCFERIKDLVLTPVQLPLAMRDVFYQILDKANDELRKKALDQIDKMLKDCIANGEAATAAAKDALAKSTQWPPERIDKMINAALAWGEAEHNAEVVKQTIKEMRIQKAATGLTEEQDNELTTLENELEGLNDEREKKFTRMAGLNKHCSESARLKNIDIIGGFLKEYLDFKTTVLLLSVAWSFPFERVTAVSGKMGLQLRLVVPGTKNPFNVLDPSDRPQRITVEACGFIEVAVSKTLNIFKRCFGIAPSTADLYVQIREIIRKRVFVSANYDLNQQKEYKKRPGMTVTLENVIRNYFIAGCHVLGGVGGSCSTFFGVGSGKHSYELTEEWLKLGLIFLGTLSCGAIAYAYAGDNNSDKLMAAVGSMMGSSQLLTTILPARNHTGLSLVTWAPGAKAGVIDHQGTKVEYTASFRGINKYMPKIL